MEIANMVAQYFLLGAIMGALYALNVLFRQKNLMRWVNIAVKAAEMYVKETGGGGLIKKEHVVSFLSKKFPHVDKNEIDFLIEEAVYRINHENHNDLIKSHK